MGLTSWLEYEGVDPQAASTRDTYLLFCTRTQTGVDDRHPIVNVHFEHSTLGLEGVSNAHG